MKKIFLITVILVSSININAQGQETINHSLKNQFNIGYFNAFNLSGINEFGVGYKRIINEKGAFRLATSFAMSKNEYNYTDHIRIENKTTITPRIGYEFRMNFEKWMVFYGIDIVASYSNNINEYTRTDPAESDRNNYREEENKGIGFSPILGVQYRLNKWISFSTETSFDFMYTKTEIFENTKFKSDKTNVKAQLSPLGIFSINLHF